MSDSPRTIFIGVAWPYVNGDLHVGHLAGYLLPADVVARYHRLRGNRVLMVSGSDCYGTPITVEADKRRVTPEALVEEYHPRVVKLFGDLRLSFDIYTKTDNPNHVATVQEFFLALLEKGLMTRGTTQQYYSAEENRFLPDRYVEGTCPKCHTAGARSDQCDACGSPLAEGTLVEPRSRTSGSPVTLRDTQHYFVDWPKLQPFLEAYVERSAPGWRPWVVSETRKWLREGLRPRAITRDLNWGVPIPVDRIPADQLIDHPDQKRIYVWFDAVIGYLSASREWAAEAPGRSWEDFWLTDAAWHYYYMGKDNLVFHTLFWPGQLHGYDPRLHLPDNPAINHFLTLEGQKFSKSRGVFLDPRALVEQCGLDAVRFYICSIAPETADADFTMAGLTATTNSILVGKIGNFINRTLTLSKGLTFSPEGEIDGPIIEEVRATFARAAGALEKSEIRAYVESIVRLSEFANRYVTEQAPWALRKEGGPAWNPARFRVVMASCGYLTLALSILLKPLIPDSVAALEAMLGVSIGQWPAEPDELIRRNLALVRAETPSPLFKPIQPA